MRDGAHLRSMAERSEEVYLIGSAKKKSVPPPTTQMAVPLATAGVRPREGHCQPLRWGCFLGENFLTSAQCWWKFLPITCERARGSAASERVAASDEVSRPKRRSRRPPDGVAAALVGTVAFGTCSSRRGKASTDAD